jgi:hypothetical protein
MKKKLRLNKESIRRLSSSQLQQAGGGLALQDPTQSCKCAPTEGLCRTLIETWCGDKCWSILDPF